MGARVRRERDGLAHERMGIVGARRVERGWRTDRGRGDALRRHPLERAPHRARGAAARLGVRLWTGRCLGGRSHRDHPSLGRSRVLRGERGDDGGPLGHLGQRALRSLGGGRQRLSRSDGHAPSPRRCWLVDRHPAAAHARGGARALQGVGLERERRLGRRSAGRRPPLRWDPLERRAGGDGRRPDLGVGHRPRSRRVRGGPRQRRPHHLGWRDLPSRASGLLAWPQRGVDGGPGRDPRRGRVRDPPRCGLCGRRRRPRRLQLRAPRLPRDLRHAERRGRAPLHRRRQPGSPTGPFHGIASTRARGSDE